MLEYCGTALCLEEHAGVQILVSSPCEAALLLLSPGQVALVCIQYLWGNHTDKLKCGAYDVKVMFSCSQKSVCESGEGEWQSQRLQTLHQSFEVVRAKTDDHLLVYSCCQAFSAGSSYCFMLRRWEEKEWAGWVAMGSSSWSFPERCPTCLNGKPLESSITSVLLLCIRSTTG